MPKTYKRRKAPAKSSAGRPRATNAQANGSGSHKKPETPVSNARTNGRQSSAANRAFFSPRVSGTRSLIYPAMIAAGCWLMAYTLIYLTNDKDRYILGGLAILMGLLWTFSFGMRVRKLLIMRQRSR